MLITPDVAGLAEKAFGKRISVLGPGPLSFCQISSTAMSVGCISNPVVLFEWNHVESGGNFSVIFVPLLDFDI